MLDSIIRDVSARWGLGDQGRPLVQMLLGAMGNSATGGLNGFLNQFRRAGLDDMVNSWISTAATPEQPSPQQVETVLGGSHGLLQQAADRLGLSYDKVTAAVAGLLPMLVDRMTPDGTVPAVLPAEFDSWTREGAGAVGAGMAAAAGAAAYGSARSVPPAAGSAPPHAHAHRTPADAERSGLGKWLPWILGAAVVLFGVTYCSKDRTDPALNTPAPAAVAPAQPAPAPSEPAPMAASAPQVSADATVPPSDSALAPGDAPAGTPMGSGTDAMPAPAAEGSAAAALAAAAPDGAAVIDDMHNGMPVLRVFFDTGKTEVADDFADKARSMAEFLKVNTDVTAVISGFNDPTGDAARNAELSKQRAQAVQQALVNAGVPADRTVLEKPTETADTAVTNAAARRVDVMLRR